MSETKKPRVVLGLPIDAGARAKSLASPTAVLEYEDVRVEMTLDYVHHLNNCGGFGDRATTGTRWNDDCVMSYACRAIEQRMWRNVDARQRCDPWPPDGFDKDGAPWYVREDGRPPVANGRREE